MCGGVKGLIGEEDGFVGDAGFDGEAVKVDEGGGLHILEPVQGFFFGTLDRTPWQ